MLQMSASPPPPSPHVPLLCYRGIVYPHVSLLSSVAYNDAGADDPSAQPLYVIL